MSFIKSSALAAMFVVVGAASCLAASEPSTVVYEQTSSEKVGGVQVAGFFDDLNDIIDTTNRVIDTVNGEPSRPQSSADRHETPRSNVQIDYSPMQQDYQRRMEAGQNRIEQMYEERRVEQARRQVEAARRQEAFDQLTPEQQQAYRARQREQSAAAWGTFFQLMQVGSDIDSVISGPTTSADEAAAAEAERMRIRMSRPLPPGESR